MSFTQLIRILWARRQMVMITTITAVLLALIAYIVMPKSYVASTSLVINSRAADPLTGSSPSLASTASINATQIDVITSRAVALKVVDALKLPTDQETADKMGLVMHTREGWAWDLLTRLTVKPVFYLIDVTFSWIFQLSNMYNSLERSL